MRINPNLFVNGRLRLCSGYPTDVKWHPLYAEDEGYHFIAASYSTGEIKLFEVIEKDGGKKVELIHERNYVADNYSECNCIDWSPDGHYIVAGFNDGNLKMFDVYTNKEVKSFYGIGHTNRVRSVSVSPNGRVIVSCSYGDNSLKLWDTITGQEAVGFNCSTPKIVDHVCFSSNGRLLIYGSSSDDRSLSLMDADTGIEVAGFIGKDKVEVISVSLSADGRFIVSGHHGNGYDTINIWDAMTGEMLDHFVGVQQNHLINSVCFSPDGRFVVSGCADKTVKLWDVMNGNEVKAFECKGHAFSVTCVSFSPDNRFIISASKDSRIKLWDISTGKEITSIGGTGHPGIVYNASFSPDGRFIVSSTRFNGNIKLWDATKGKEVSGFDNIEDDRGTLDSTSFSPDGRFIVYCLAYNYGHWFSTIKLVNATNGKDLGNFNYEGYISSESVSISPDCRLISSGYHDMLRVWDLTTGEGTIYEDSRLPSPVCSTTFSPDGCSIIGFCARGGMKLWDATTGKEVSGFDNKEYDAGLFAPPARFSPDGRFIVTGGNYDISRGDDWKRIKLWDATTGKKVNVFDGTEGESVSFSPDGRFIVSRFHSNTIKLLDATTGKEVNSLDDKVSDPHVVNFSPDGRFIVYSSSLDAAISILNLEEIFGLSWLKDHLNSPLILTGVWFPDESLQYMRETNQGNIVNNQPIARCGECGLFFPVEDNMLGKELRCPNETERGKCNRLVKLNEFTAGVER